MKYGNMRLLKYRHLFYGKEMPVYLAWLLALTVPPLCAWAIGCDLFDLRVWICCAPAAALGTLLFCAMHIRTLSDKDCRLIERAAQPEWRKPSESDRRLILQPHLQQLRHHAHKMGIEAALLALIVLFTCMIFDSMNWALFRILLPCFCGIPVLLLLRDLFLMQLWRSADADAEICDIPVSATFTREQHNITMKHTRYFLVCYLPSGKYVLQCSDECKQPHTVRFMRYRRHCIYYPY